MKKKSSNRKSIACRIMLLTVGVATPGISFAYMDPGSISLLIQGLIGALAAAGAAVSLYWNNIKTFFGRLKNRRNAGPRPGAEADDNHPK